MKLDVNLTHRKHDHGFNSAIERSAPKSTQDYRTGLRAEMFAHILTQDGVNSVNTALV